MSRREAVLTGLGILVLAAAIRAVAAASLVFPVPEDTAYYAGVARNIVEGRGIVTDALWSYQTPPLTAPRAAFEIWMPLPSLLEALVVAAFGVANWFRAAQLVSILAGAATAVLAWRMGVDLATERGLAPGRARTLAVGSGLVAAVLAPLALYGALPDSTALFAMLSMAAFLLMTRISAEPAGVRDRRLLALGAVLGLAALTRSEALWLGLTWLLIAFFATPGTLRERIFLVVAPALVAGLFFAPWAARDWLAFGSPLPGQTVSNALSVNGYDIFAYQVQPSLSRLLAQGPAELVSMRIEAFGHNLGNVLLFPAFPVSLVGLAGLAFIWRSHSIRPLVVASGLTFVLTTLLFPVSTLWGTYLHAAGSAYVLLILGCLVATDELIVVIGRLRHWTRPVAWLGTTFALAASLLVCNLSIATLGSYSVTTQDRYEELSAAMSRAGLPLASLGPVITDHPVWLAEATRTTALALPEEPPASVLDLAGRFGARVVVLTDDDPRIWPGVLSDGSAASRCFSEVHLTDSGGQKPLAGSPLSHFRVFRIVCP